MNIQGNRVVVEKSQKETFEFLTDLKNFEQLMPESIQKFEVDGDSFIFMSKVYQKFERPRPLQFFAL